MTCETEILLISGSNASLVHNEILSEIIAVSLYSIIRSCFLSIPKTLCKVSVFCFLVDFFGVVVLLVIYSDSLKLATPLFMSTGFLLNNLYILIL